MAPGLVTVVALFVLGVHTSATTTAATPAQTGALIVGQESHHLVPGKPYARSGKVNYNTTETLFFSYESADSQSVIITTAREVELGPDGRYVLASYAVQPCGHLSWHMPLQFASSECRYNTVSRQLCPNDNCGSLGEFALTLSSIAELDYSLEVEVKRTLIRANETELVVVTPAGPRYFRLDLGDWRAATLRILSDDDNYAIVSVQNDSCPVYDLPSDVTFTGLHQTMTTKSFIHIDRQFLNQDLQDSDVYAVLVVLPGDEAACDVSKTFTVSLHETMSYSEYWRPIMAMVAYFALFFLVTFVVILYEKLSQRGINEPVVAGLSERTPLLGSVGSAKASDPGSRVSRQESTTSAISAGSVALSVASWDGFDRSLRFRNRGKLQVHVSDLTRKLPETQDRKFGRYLMVLVIVAVFYFLPALQLVLGYLDIFNRGAQDLCYLNFACQRPLYGVQSVNSIVSNFGYVALGILYLLVVRRRSRVYNLEKKTRGLSTPEETLGLPRHYGIFYAMGLGMVAEGFFSALYHVCPNASNFQFDTAFMYIIGGLMLAALYQRRHADVKSSAPKVYALLGLIIMLNVFGVYFSSRVFYSTIFVLFLVIGYYIGLQVYYLGAWRFGSDKRKQNIYEMWAPDAHEDGGGSGGVFEEPARFAEYPTIDWVHRWYSCGLYVGWPQRQNQFVLVTLAFGINSCVFIMGIITSPEDSSTFFLAAVVSNVFVYLGYYACMKKLSGERWTAVPLTCLVLGFLLWIPALYFFIEAPTNWVETPAVSRELNQACVVLNFFDKHDLWHMFSASAMYISNICLLTLDDDVVAVPRKNIVSF